VPSGAQRRRRPALSRAADDRCGESELAAIGLQLLEDFEALAVEDAHADRTRRQGRVGRRADRVGRVGRLDVGLGDNGRTVIARDGEELKAELPRFDIENAFQFFQLPDL
jgi:hypothetical protein